MLAKVKDLVRLLRRIAITVRTKVEQAEVR
jgi:hypothetical protein